MEDRFDRVTGQRRIKRLRLETLLATLLFDLFLIADFYGSPYHFERAVLVRLLLVTPICMVIHASLGRVQKGVWRELSLAYGVCLAGLAQLYLELNRSQVTSAYVQMTVLAVILFANLVLRLRLPYAAATSAVMLAGDALFLWKDQMLRTEDKVFGAGIVLGATTLTLVANYNACREERLSYLLHLRGELLVADLNRLNAQLVRRSESDALTGLANRRSFDTQYAELWRAALTSAGPLSVVIVDVDYFKRLNDRYGHLYGDEVLKRIASLLQQALRVKDDYAARFGGEEFVILLPRTPEHAAIQVAERLRKMVELAGFPAIDPEEGPYDLTIRATVSCGVACAYPTAKDTPEQLLEAADKALYQAKAEGRNKVCCAPSNAPAGSPRFT
ncbi:MAG TPA: GGDEF domain-containing protein [Edaphobacter sp.]|nr:GGDEF domain-containing protein [Edaphobacter sp.]